MYYHALHLQYWRCRAISAPYAGTLQNSADASMVYPHGTTIWPHAKIVCAPGKNAHVHAFVARVLLPAPACQRRRVPHSAAPVSGTAHPGVVGGGYDWRCDNAAQANGARQGAWLGETRPSPRSSSLPRAGGLPGAHYIPGVLMPLRQFVPGAQPVDFHKQPASDHARHVDHQ